MTSADRLLTTENLHGKLYDADSMLDVKRSVAAGYVVLLNGGPASAAPNSNAEGEDENLPLAFMSLTSGNVIDTCFGVVNPSMRGDTPARRSARAAKELLDENDTTDSFRQIAVTAYCEAFKVIMNYNDQMDKLNCFAKCFKSKAIRNETEEKIRAVFDSLVVAMGNSS
uniref:Uncharacterized protein n=1 Tax=Pseudo-nitzschia delicatissima TaxID=44447 RepID=A0A6T9ZM48_9STRA|mmetsp:Transcript_213/g.485  ORF Transcript_213/g.485 Transcript_213/m.485 type:complete len:169 (+) Transcript_213:302-808(+)